METHDASKLFKPIRLLLPFNYGSDVTTIQYDK